MKNRTFIFRLGCITMVLLLLAVICFPQILAVLAVVLFVLFGDTPTN